MTHGTWDICEGIVERWIEQGLDEAFTAEWADSTLVSRYSPFNETEAREGTPKPHCVFEVEGAQSLMLQSNEGATVKALANVPLVFRIHATTKPQAVELAKAVAAAFDNASFAAGDTCVIGLARLADFGGREADDDWTWVLRYGIIQDAEQATNR